CHGQALLWSTPRDLLALPLSAADRPVAVQLLLPRTQVITPDPGADHGEFLEEFARTVAGGARFIQLRAPRLSASEVRPLARAAVEIARSAGVLATLNGHVELARELGFDGVHLPARMAARFQCRPVTDTHLLGVSCHDQQELALARQVGAD